MDAKTQTTIKHLVARLDSVEDNTFEDIVRCIRCIESGDAFCAGLLARSLFMRGAINKALLSRVEAN